MATPLPLLLTALTCVGSDVVEDSDPFETLLLPWIEEAIESVGALQQQQQQRRPPSETLALRRGPHGQSLHAEVAFEKGAIISIIPQSRLARDKSHASLAWALAKHHSQGDMSRLLPYISVLPPHHPERPARWDSELLRRHLQGSGFQSYVQERDDRIRADFEAMQQQWQRGGRGPRPSWESFLWAHDTVSTRHMAAPHRMMMLFPLGDLCNHADQPNVELKWMAVSPDGDRSSSSSSRSSRAGGGQGRRQQQQQEKEELCMRAARQIRAGEELHVQYFDDGSQGALTNWQSLELWGFTTPLARPVAMLQTLPAATAAAAASAAAIGGSCRADGGAAAGSCASIDSTDPASMAVQQLLRADGGLFVSSLSARNFTLSANIEKDDGPALLAWLHDAVATAAAGGLLQQTDIAPPQNTGDGAGPKSDRGIAGRESVAMQQQQQQQLLLLLCRALCRELCGAALELYPQTLEQDEATLAEQQQQQVQEQQVQEQQVQGQEDRQANVAAARVETLIRLRLDEKRVLRWWRDEAFAHYDTINAQNDTGME